MNKHFPIDPWRIIQTGFDPKDQRFAESLLSLGNGAFGLRGNFEEDYSGDTLKGTYIGGIWFPDKTRVGWWKNGYPQYFGKVINAMNLIGLSIQVNGQEVDAGVLKVLSFRRELDMKTGILSRQMHLALQEGSIQLSFERFVSMDDKALMGIHLELACDFDAQVQVHAYLDGNVHNEDSNYQETFWQNLDQLADSQEALAALKAITKENPFGTPRFTVTGAFHASSTLPLASSKKGDGHAALTFKGQVKAGETVRLDKLLAVLSDRDHPADGLMGLALDKAKAASRAGYAALKAAHVKAWAGKWELADVVIQGDPAAQQGIRFNLFHLHSTYTGEDARLNIGPKGFTGEKYGGATYWDTEAYCFPVYLATAGEKVAEQLLRYRHQQLPGAYHNARQQGLAGALYPMVTFNGIECHNEWEITFMELHRNAAIAYAIFHYTSYTGKTDYLLAEGLEVLLGIARFWAGRVHFNQRTQRYMLHGVTGPNEYENNVNNNWYTNRMAAWCLDFFADSLGMAGEERRRELGVSKVELAQMRDISQRMYYGVDERTGVFIQHDTFLDKDLRAASSLLEEERPLNQHWSWDKILRSCFIKQADVLQGMYFLNHLYDQQTKQKNFDFYEPMTVHESSLSPCVHAILAAELGYEDKAVQLYHRTARLDLDNINRDTEDGLHITSMSGAWLAIAQGFAGMRTTNGLSFAPFLPAGWQAYSFRFYYQGRLVRFQMDQDGVSLKLLSGQPLDLCLWNQAIRLVDENQEVDG